MRKKMTYTKLMMVTLVVGLLTLNGCMLKHLIGDDEEAMGGHESMGMHGMMHTSDDAEMEMDMEEEHEHDDE